MERLEVKDPDTAVQISLKYTCLLGSYLASNF